MLHHIACGMQVSVTELKAVANDPSATFLELVEEVLAAGRSAVMRAIRGHPVSKLMRRFREQVCAGPLQAD